MTKSLKILFLFILTSFASSRLLASPQIPDYVIYKNDTIAVYNLLLEDYFHKVGTSDQGQLFGLSFRDNSSTSCWRGYQAVYTIDNDSLFIKYILYCGEFRHRKDSLNTKSSDEKMKTIFGDKVVNKKVYVNWYTGNISFPRGDLLRWDGVFSRTYYKEEILSFKKGLLSKKKLVSNYIDLPKGISRDFSKEKYHTDYKLLTDTIFSIIQKQDWKKLSDCDCDQRYLIVINAKGKIRQVKLFSYLDEKENDDYEKDLKKCITKFKHLLKNLQFDIVKWNGKPYEEKIVFEIFYTVDGKLENQND